MVKKLNRVPQNRPLTNIDLLKYAKGIPHFRGVFMRNNLPVKIRNYECGIINLDSQSGKGTHWTAYVKKHDSVVYFDSFGNLRPPKEVVKYFNNGDVCVKISIYYNHDPFQKYNEINCGQLCLNFLYNNM